MRTQNTSIDASMSKHSMPFAPVGLPVSYPPARRLYFENQPINHLSTEDQRLFKRFGQGPVVTPSHSHIHCAFEDRVEKNPDAIAARHLDQSITYRELNRQASRLAAIMDQHGVKSGDHVGLFLERSIPMLVGILATLKLGAAYVPQHVGITPREHLGHIIETANIRIILTLDRLEDQIPVAEGQVCLAIDKMMAREQSREHDIMRFTRGPEIDPDQTCFLLFTSGTTGRPNGVQVTHKNVCNILLTEPGNLGVKPGMKVAQILSIAFDMAAWEIFVCLSHGATLIIRGKDIQAAAEQADVVIATPTILGSLDDARCHNVRIAAVAGEPCPRPLADTWSKFATFYNSCGPTETTIINTAQRYDEACKDLTIGKPTPNNTVYVLDQDRKACAIGEVGEMWAGGDCVTAGYLANDVLNRERYLPDPFLGGGRMMFRTRDLGRWNAEGELEHYGRVDDQVKVRGFRVELNSVSAAMESDPDCSQAVALKLDNRSLVGFVSPQTVDSEKAKKVVADLLPYYCVPAFVIALPELPMTSRGKVDKRILLDMALRQQETQQTTALQASLQPSAAGR